MEAAAAAFSLLSTILDLVKQAADASKEKHDAIVAALVKADTDLKTARDAAHASVDADNADMQKSLDDATKPGG
jgi:hypothetical protein